MSGQQPRSPTGPRNPLARLATRAPSPQLAAAAAAVDQEQQEGQFRVGRRLQSTRGGTDSTGRKEYQIQVEVIEARELKGPGTTGTLDPVIVIDVCGEKQHTAVMKKCNAATWNHLFFFNVNLTAADYEHEKISIRCYDAGTFRDKLIGKYEIEVAKVHGRKDHEYWRRWMALTDFPDHDDIRGFLKASVTVLGPNEFQASHENDAGDDDEDLDSMDLQDLVLRPPEVDLTPYHLNVTVYRCEELPAASGLSQRDPYVSLRFASTSIDSEPARKTTEPIFNTQLTVPVLTPTMSDRVQVLILDRNRLASDEIISSALFRFTDVQLADHGIGPKWVCLYRPKTATFSEGLFRLRNRKNLMRELTEYCGRALVSLSAEPVPAKRVARANRLLVAPAPMPATQSYTLRFDLLQGAEFPASLLQNVQIEVHVGSFIKKVVGAVERGGNVPFYQQFEDASFALPIDPDSHPLIVIEAHIKDKLGGGKARIGYIKYLTNDPDVAGFNQPARWVPLIRDTDSPVTGDEDIPGFLLFRCEFGPTSSLPAKPREKLVVPALKKYQLRAHIYQGYDLPPADDTGTSDPYCVIRMGHKRVKTKKRMETCYPLWYETVCMDVELPTPLTIAPSISVLVYDWDQVGKDDFLGRFEVPAAKAPRRGPGDPKWYELYVNDPKRTDGRVLASFQLIPLEEALKTPLPNLVPKSKSCLFEISVVGVRSMIPYRLSRVKKPQIEFDTRSILESGEEKREPRKTAPSDQPSGENANFLEVLEVPMQLPLNKLYAPSVNLTVYDTSRLTNKQVGASAVSLEHFIPWTNLEKPAPPPVLIRELADDAGALNVPGLQTTVAEVAHEIPEKLEDCNETPAERIEFSIMPSHDFVQPGERTMPDVAETSLGDDDPDQQVGPSECYDRELESLLTDIPFLDFDIYRGKARGLNFVDKLFRTAAADQRPVVGTFKGRFRVLETEKLNSYPPKLDLRDMFRGQEYVVRVYCLRGRNLVPKDRNGSSDPYLVVELGGQKISDVKRYIPRTLKPDFFRYFELKTVLPGDSALTVSVFDHDAVGSDELIGSTTIDLEDRLFSEKWKQLCGGPSPKPRECRTLWAPTSRNPQGKLEMWVEILTLDQARTIPPVPISPPQPEEWELRVVVWETNKCTLKAGDMGDIFVSGILEGPGQERQRTDVHWRSKDGTGLFNWRFVFPVTLPSEIPRLKFQIWDQALVRPNDAIAEAVLNLKGFFARARKSHQKQIIERGRIKMTHPNFEKVQGELVCSIEVLPAAEARAHPVGKGRDEPNTDPHLDEPERPGSFAPWRVDLLLREKLMAHKWKFIIALVIFLFIVVGIPIIKLFV